MIFAQYVALLSCEHGDWPKPGGSKYIYLTITLCQNYCQIAIFVSNEWNVCIYTTDNATVTFRCFYHLDRSSYIERAPPICHWLESGTHCLEIGRILMENRPIYWTLGEQWPNCALCSSDSLVTLAWPTLAWRSSDSNSGEYV